MFSPLHIDHFYGVPHLLLVILIKYFLIEIAGITDDDLNHSTKIPSL